MFPNFIPKEDIPSLPLIRFEGNIHLIDTPEELAHAIRNLRQEEIVGFDTETKPTFNKGEYNHTALIQFATPKDAYLIRINALGIPPSLKSILEDQVLQKVGISIRDDLKDLKRISSFKPGGFIDLNDIARELGVTQIGMKSLSGIFLKSRISKSQQTSNWESKELTKAQQSYAATDAWVCVKIYALLQKKGYV